MAWEGFEDGKIQVRLARPSAGIAAHRPEGPGALAVNAAVLKNFAI